MENINKSYQKILLVDDNLNNLTLLGNILKTNGYRSEFTTNGTDAIKRINKEKFDLVLLDILMPDITGFEVCKQLRSNEKTKDIPIIFLSAKNDKVDILEGFKLGAQDYVVKPFDEEILLARVKTHLLLHSMQKQMGVLVEKRTNELEIAQIELKKSLIQLQQLKDKLQDENQYMQEEIKLNNNFEDIVGQSKSIQKTLKSVQQVAPTDSTVLIKGETGTGKELVARAINNMSPRNKQPLIKINCAAIPESLIESELFGHEKGAFTGAIALRKGKFELADNGTLFLDEIGELPLSLQPKLLRVLQEGEFERIGGNKTIKVNVRLISATNRDLDKMVEDGTFRSDLFYRLNIFPITVEALRNRTDDIPPLVTFFIDKFRKKFGKKELSISNDQLLLLQNYSYPGNIRELENIIERAIISSEGKHIKLDPSLLANKPGRELTFKPMDEVEREYILLVLESTNWTISGEAGAAEILKIHPNTLRSKMQKLGIKKNMSFK